MQSVSVFLLFSQQYLILLSISAFTLFFLYVAAFCGLCDKISNAATQIVAFRWLPGFEARGSH